MPLLLASDALPARRTAVAGPLAPLAASLAADLERVLAAAPAPDPRKARLTRAGGRCPDDGAALAFDPFEPHDHRCPRCGRVWRDEAHDRWWLMWHQLWLAERAVHAAVLHLLVGAPRLAAFAAATLDAYAERYLGYPNRDNVLGPSRPFFSTYLESIWLLQLCVALDALECADAAAYAPLGARVRERVVEPSRQLIAGFPEGRSNRQVWNAAALLAASRVLGDDEGVARWFDAPGGVTEHLLDGLLADGSWYEGENYHQFAHRGLWYGVTLAESAGLALPPALARRFSDGFAAPYLVALPDLTLPARRDSQYAISLRQWRYAEMFELGLAREPESAPLAAVLGRLYDGGAPAGDTGRWRSAAESERNEPPAALTRAELGWRSLLHARAEPSPAIEWAPGAVHLAAQGLAVFRRDGGRLWVAVDYGHSGGGHGHPDRLNLLVADGATRWLDDMGAGSYVERALHWYRSTLAHNAPLVDGASQPRGDGALLDLDLGGEAEGITACARIGADVDAARRVRVAGELIVDQLVWTAPRAVTVDLPWHVDGEITLLGTVGSVSPLWEPVERLGAGGLEDGFDFVEDAERMRVPDDAVVRLALRTPAGGQAAGAALWLVLPAGAELWRAAAPGPPGAGARRFHVARAVAARGRMSAVLDVRGRVAAVTHAGDALEIIRHDGGLTVHPARPIVPAPPAPAFVQAATPHRQARPIDDARPFTCTLGEPHYRPSEESWRDAGRPEAQVAIRADGQKLYVAVEVRLGRPTTFVPPGTENLLDNERPEVNGDGVQLFVRGSAGPMAGWLVAPELGGGVRAVATTPAAAALPIRAAWRATADGYAVELAVDRAALARAGDDARVAYVDVLVNEMPPGRERRRGQLVLSGAGGTFVYLQGDRHDPARLLPLALPPLAAP